MLDEAEEERHECRAAWKIGRRMAVKDAELLQMSLGCVNLTRVEVAPMQQPQSPLVTYAEFREFCATHDGYYELVDGRPVALASPSKPHGRLTQTLSRRIGNHLDGAGRRCDVYAGNDVWTGRNSRRPDLAVSCDEADIENDEDLLRAPVLLIEILSANEGDDLKAKLDEYQSMASVEEYVVIDSRKRFVRHYYRGSDGLFVFDHDNIAGTIRLASIGFSLDIDATYTEARIQ